MPYPGCEFFKQFKDNNYCGENLKFNWKQTFINAKIYVPEVITATATPLNIDWNEYEKWDIILVTQNYVKLILKYLRENSDGMLVHCISGWDRTPLFVSLLRVLLWADGSIHQSLNARQMLYFTLAYDWYLFGHNLPDRLSKGEDILFFCFYVIKYFHDEEYACTTSNRRTTRDSGSSNDTCPSGVGSVGSNLSESPYGSAKSHSSLNLAEMFIDSSNG